MYPVSSAVKALFDAEQRQVLRITGTDKNGTSISITDADVEIGGFNIDRYCCNGEKLEVGTAIAGQMTLKLNNVNGAFSGIAFEGAELFAEIGIADWSQENPTVNWIPCGYFTPDMQPRKLNKIELTCLDRMTRFEAVVDEAALTLPATVAGLVGQVNTLCGVTLAADISTLPNANVVIAALPNVAGDMTYRNIIQWCAGIMATNAWFDWNGQLRFTWYDGVTGYETTTANRFSSDFFEDDLTITGAVYTNASGVEIVEGTDDYAIDLTGNALVGPIVATVLPAVNTAVNGFVYRPFTAVVSNAPYLWPMDLVDFTDKDGNTYSGALTNVAFGLNRHTALESKGLTYALNERAQPKGVTKEQAQLITQAMERVETDIDESLTQEDIFNRLTDNGTAQGLLLTQDGQLYVNASYIRSGTLVLGGLNNQNGTLRVLDANGNEVGSWDNAGITAINGKLSLPYTNGEIFIGDPTSEGLPGPLYITYTDRSVVPPITRQMYWFSDCLKFDNTNNRNVLELSDQHVSIYADPAEICFVSVENIGGGGVTMYNDGSIESSDTNGNSTEILPTHINTGAMRLNTPLGVDSGGTGASTASAARANLDVYSTGEVNTMFGGETVTTDIFTPATGITVNRQRLEIIGKLHILQLDLRSDTSISARMNLGTVASDYNAGRAVNGVTCPCSSAINGRLDGTANCYMAANGTLTADYVGSAYREIYVTLIYFR